MQRGGEESHDDLGKWDWDWIIVFGRGDGGKR